MNRRAFIAALGGVAAWPVVARAGIQPRRRHVVGVDLELTNGSLGQNHLLVPGHACPGRRR